MGVSYAVWLAVLSCLVQLIISHTTTATAAEEEETVFVTRRPLRHSLAVNLA